MVPWGRMGSGRPMRTQENTGTDFKSVPGLAVYWATPEDSMIWKSLPPLAMMVVAKTNSELTIH